MTLITMSNPFLQALWDLWPTLDPHPLVIPSFYVIYHSYPESRLKQDIRCKDTEPDVKSSKIPGKVRSLPEYPQVPVKKCATV